MPNAAEVIESWFQQHFSHITPGTPDHFTVTRAKDDLIARLTPPPSKKQPAKSTP